MIFMLIIAVYDVLAVRFGFMVWMADKLSQSSSLAAFSFCRRKLIEAEFSPTKTAAKTFFGAGFDLRSLMIF